MAKLSVTIDGLNTTKLALQNGLQKAVDEIADATHDALVAKTPIASGNARRGWRTTKGHQTFTSENRVPYIERLENNWSKQTKGQGIVNPALKLVRGKLK